MSLNKNFYAPEDYEASVPRAWHDISTKRSFTPQTGQLIPVYNRRMYAGDEFKISVGSLLQTINPLTYPLLDCFELRLEYYYCPLSNYYGWMDNNTRNSTKDILNNRFKWSARLLGFRNEIANKSTRTGILSKGNLENRYIPFTGISSESMPNVFVNSNHASENVYGNLLYFSPNITPDVYLKSIAEVQNVFDFRFYPEETVFRGSLMETLGVSAGVQSCFGFTNSSGDYSLDVNIEPFLCYLDIWRTYHANLQYNFALVSGLSSASNVYSSFDLYYDSSIWSDISQLDELFMELRYISGKLSATYDDLLVKFNPAFYEDYGEFNQSYKQRLYSHLVYACRPLGGYMPVQYRPDMWRNLLSSNIGSVKSSVRVSDGVITVDEFRQSNKIQKLIDAIDLSGGRYSNLIKTIFGWKSKRQLDIPHLLGVTTHLIDPSNITAMANSDGVNLGQMGAKVDKYNTSKEFTVKSDADGYLMICASIVPRVSYSQGILPNLLRVNFSDDFDPNLQRLGFQDVPKIDLSVHPDNSYAADNSLYFTSHNLGQVVGKQIAWIDEITDVNRVFGEFSSWGGVYSPMVLQRNFSKFDLVSSSEDAGNVYRSTFLNSPYVSLSDNRDIFADYSAVSSPWSLHLAFNIKAKRPIGKRYRPNLE